MWTYRCWQLLLAWGCVGACYTLASLWPTASPWVLTPSMLDQAIRFQPLWMPVYLSFFAFIPYGFMQLEQSALPTLRVAFQCCGVVSALVFIAFPTSLAYPSHVALQTDGGVFWAWWHHMDTPQNCLPSLHASLTTVVCLAWLTSPQAACKQRWVIFVWYGLILFSILACKRHFALDVAAGMALGTLCYVGAAYRHSARQLSYKVKT